MGISKPIISLYDVPMWESIARRRLELQCCSGCGKFRYPPGPVCPYCLSMQYAWTPVSGRGVILSWVVFHKQYFEDHVPPYNAVAVQLAEDVIVMSNLVGEQPQGNWINTPVELGYAEHAGRVQHQVRLASGVARARAAP